MICPDGPRSEPTKRIVDALLQVQRQLARSGPASAADLLKRARLLLALGEREAALDDLRQAHDLDAADPDILLLLCRHETENAHGFAVQLITSEFATKRQRMSALRHVDPDRLPLVGTCTLAVTGRVTIVQTIGQTARIGGLEDGDFAELLKPETDNDPSVIALDHFIARPTHAPRMITSDLDGRIRTLTIPPMTRDAPRCGAIRARAPLWVIVPVHDGGDSLETCLTSTIREVRAMKGAHLVLVDDASRQAATRALLDALKGEICVTLLHTPRNLGFTGAVNLGLSHIGKGPVILLNSDTYVPRFSFRRMVAHLEEDGVGTVTPLSNNARSFSIPTPRTAHAMPSAKECEELARAAFRLHPRQSVDVLNGNGFAMLISEPCREAVGTLSELYSDGYYEEVDFCLRASQVGFRHLAALDIFVGHVGSVSFADRKARLVAQNRRRLLHRFDSYEGSFKRFALVDPIAPYRQRLMQDVSWQPVEIARTAPERAAARTLTLPQVGRVFVPLAQDMAATTPAFHFDRLIPIAQDGWSAAGIALQPPHRLKLTLKPAPDRLFLGEDGGPPIGELRLTGAEKSDFLALEDLALRLLERDRHGLPI